MASNSEITFGARINNAEQLLTHLATFGTYNPISPDIAVPAYTTLIDDTKTNNALVATNASNFSLAVDNRINLFNKNPDSLHKILSPIFAYIKAKFGKTSKQATDIATLITKIRGEKTNKLKKDQEGEFVSQSQRSYGSQTQHFADIIATLTSYGADYTPTNTNITLVKLNAFLQILTNANIAVTTAYGALKPSKELRITQYADLKDRSNRIKDSIKSQYGLSSSEYKLIKGFKI